MDFTLSDEHRHIQETIRDFGEREVKPHAAAWDREERFPHETVQRLGALGFLGVALPEDVGGGGADTHANLRVVEGIARYGASLGLTVALLSGASPTGYRCTSFLILGVANPLTVTLVGGATAFASLNEQFQGHPPQPVARAALSRVWLIWRTSERR